MRAASRETLAGLSWLPDAVAEAVYERMHSAPDPLQQIPVQQIPVRQVPVRQVPVQQVPVQQIPAAYAARTARR